MNEHKEKTGKQGLSRRELAILALAARGNTRKATAEMLAVSDETVKAHLESILQKLNAKNKTHAVSIAAALGFLEDCLEELRRDVLPESNPRMGEADEKNLSPNGGARRLP